MLRIDGARGEGGGQVLRTALGLSLVTGKPFEISRIRANRGKPGLLAQHLTGVRAATQIGRAEVSGDKLGSSELRFTPRALAAGDYSLSIGSAGSASLVLQTVLPAMLRADAPTTLAIEGGTHNPLAPPFDFLRDAFAPVLERMGARLELRLERYGFAPAGGGRIVATVVPRPLQPIELSSRGALLRRMAKATVSGIPEAVARRELTVVENRLELRPEELVSESVVARGAGNALAVTLEFESITEVFVGFGAKGVAAERIATTLCKEVREYLQSDAPVGSHLADQLIIPFALAGGGSFRTIAPTEHTRTQIDLVQEFLEVAISLTEDSPRAWRVQIGRG